MAAEIDPDEYTRPMLLTSTSRRSPYPAISPSSPSNSASGKIIIITGSGSGIGAAAAKVWARAGATGVVLAGRHVEAFEKWRRIYHRRRASRGLFEDVTKGFGRGADVLLNNAVYHEPVIGEMNVEEWWKAFEVNLKGLYSMIYHYIHTQPNPKEPVGTIITVGSSRAGLTIPGGSAYNISKLAEQKLTEHIQLENPTLRLFTTMPGISPTESLSEFWKPYALDHVDMVGMLALYLVQPRADYLKGCMVSVNWDVEEMEAHKDEIVNRKLLQTSWLPILPVEGGKGLDV